MKDKLRELAEWWRPYSSETEAMADGILDILDAEGDGGAVPDDNLPGMWSNADFTGGAPDERCHAARVSEDEQFNAFRLAYYGANKSLAPELESFRRAYQTITHPARSGVVSDGDTMLEDLAEVVREIDADTKLVKATIAATRFVNEHHATLAQNAEDSRRLKALIAMRDRWATDEREFLNRFGQHLPTSLACLIEQFDGIMRGGE